jgi:hypothetical protein
MKRESLTTGLAFLLCIAFTVFVVGYSSRYGRLAFPPDYDDSHSLVEGGLRWLTLKQQGLRAAWDEYLRRPPHSFLHYYFAAGSFALFGVHAIVAYWANSLFLMVAVLGFVALIGARDNLRTLPLVAAFLGIPAAFNLIFDFRSECAMAALLFAASCCLIRAAWAPRHQRNLWSIGAGALLALCLGIKPAMFPYTLGMAMAGTFLLVVGVASRDPRNWVAGLRGAGLVWALMIVPFAFHYIRNWDFVAGYIFNIAFKEDMYKQQGNLAQQLAYHFVGFPGRFQLGSLAWPLLIVTVVSNGVAAFVTGNSSQSTRRHLFSCTFLTAIAYVGVAVNAMVQNYFGMTFHFLLGASALLGIAYLAELLPPRAGHLLCWIVAIAVIAGWKVPPSQNYLERTEAVGGQRAVGWRREGPIKAFEAIRPYWNDLHPPVAWVATYGWTDGNTIAWEAVQRDLAWKVWNYYEKQPEPGELFPSSAELLIVPAPGVMGTIDLPCNENLQAIHKALEADPNAERIAEIIDPLGKPIRIYRRIPTIRTSAEPG